MKTGATERPPRPATAGPSSSVVRSKIRTLIERRMAPGEKLPSEADLAHRFSVSRNTVREALGELGTLGLIERRWGHGTFVSSGIAVLQKQLNELLPIPDVVRQAGMTCGLELYSYRIGVLPPSMGFADATADFDQVWELERVYSADAVPFIHLRDYLPATWRGRPLDPSTLKDSIWELMRQQWDTAFSFATADVVAVAVPGPIAERLMIEPGTPVIRDRQHLFTSGNEPIACTESFLRTDVISLKITRRYAGR